MSNESIETNFGVIEKKWQEKWFNSNAFTISNSKKKFYVLEMFPYPSSAGLHMGHALNYIIGDIQARFKRMNGYSVLYPMGFDALGLPAENAAIKAGEHPQDYTNNSINNFVIQQKALGLSYDWNRIIRTSDEEYYKWNQFFFIKFFENDLVYRKKSAVNWCSECNTVLANEQVHNGKCWRHSDTNVEVKHLEQWFIKTTKYADELLEKVSELNWPDRIKAMQKNWIGKSFGTEIFFKINGVNWPVFTTRPDTIFGVTFLVISAQHEKLFSLVTSEQKNAVEEFLKKIKSVSEKELDELNKEGVFTGSYAINPINNERVPVYAGNFVVAEYGSGVVMAVPTHDQRDFDFAKKYGLDLKVVISSVDSSSVDSSSVDSSSVNSTPVNSNSVDSVSVNSVNSNTLEKILSKKELSRAFTGEGVLINSGEFSGLNNLVAMGKITDYLIEKNLGKRTTNFKLRDWLVSRQRYWGTPIPIIYCDECGAVPVPLKDLPVKLPYEVRFGEGNPLETNKEFVFVDCPKCGGKGRRETDTMDTFFDSSWYYLRFVDPTNALQPFNKELVSEWLPVDLYIGGAEHACMHLIYARFFTKALRDLGLVDFSEPFTKLFNQGMLHGSDGNKMSKSLGNVVNPLDLIKKYSADSLRFNLVSLSAPNSDSVWSEKGMDSSFKFIQRIYSMLDSIRFGSSTKLFESKLNRLVKEISFDIENFRYNLGVIKIRGLFEALFSEEEVSKENYLIILKLLHPFCPHITEELYANRIRGGDEFVSNSNWPVADENKINLGLEKIEGVVSSLRSDILKVRELSKIKNVKKIKVFVASEWKLSALRVILSECEEKPTFDKVIKLLLSKDEFRGHASELAPFIKTALNKLSEFSDLSEFDEFSVLTESKPLFEKEFGLGVIELIRASDSTESKAKNAFPTKPALLIEGD